DGTEFFGSIAARGGAQRGNGGFVEISGKDGLQFTGTVDTRAPFANSGMLLLDPNQFTVAHATTTGGDSSAGTAPNFAAGALSSTITDFTINQQFATTSVAVTASGDIVM